MLAAYQAGAKTARDFRRVQPTKGSNPPSESKARFSQGLRLLGLAHEQVVKLVVVFIAKLLLLRIHPLALPELFSKERHALLRSCDSDVHLLLRRHLFQRQGLAGDRPKVVAVSCTSTELHLFTGDAELVKAVQGSSTRVVVNGSQGKDHGKERASQKYAQQEKMRRYLEHLSATLRLQGVQHFDARCCSAQVQERNRWKNEAKLLVR
mmetsp:Transcript_13331/g.49501  ORF Transcript_13331/g.49501 Transcript_13331/m.49501 type:complete len:208 (+) Transcript_13331:2598-3221(+)